MDLIHHYLAERTPPEKIDQLNRSLTGDLDTFMPTPVPATPQLRPPPWLRIRPTDIARMAQARGQ